MLILASELLGSSQRRHVQPHPHQQNSGQAVFQTAILVLNEPSDVIVNVVEIGAAVVSGSFSLYGVNVQKALISLFRAVSTSLLLHRAVRMNEKLR